MKTGDFNRRISILSYESVINEEGFTEETWLSVAEVWAAVKTTQGREFYQAATVQAERKTRFVIRYSKKMESLLKNDMRISYKGREFDIKSVINDDEANITFTIMTEEVDVK
ncbi:phage head closure protein [Bacillus subtilis]|uniref:phage head closure protein n=1 Tax=Bacillus subtilis TaxID=1423 RepID=UPI0011C7A0F1|nr:phage head closure protein [Bacillus subtilis]TXK63726.1 head-tail adaptor protein [Bacillus subtilis]HEQ3553586.1 phage head closure protein [Enterococcus faecalis]